MITEFDARVFAGLDYEYTGCIGFPARPTQESDHADAVFLAGRRPVDICERVWIILGEDGKPLWTSDFPALADGQDEAPVALVGWSLADTMSFTDFLAIPPHTDELLGSWYMGRFWWITGEDTLLPTGDLAALISAKARKRQRAIERAHAYATMGLQPNEVRRRKAIPDDVKVFVWRRDEGRCAKCGTQDNLEFDHIIPLAMGGSNTHRNLQLLCEGCNREKGSNLA